MFLLFYSHHDVAENNSIIISQYRFTVLYLLLLQIKESIKGQMNVKIGYNVNRQYKLSVYLRN